MRVWASAALLTSVSLSGCQREDREPGTGDRGAVAAGGDSGRGGAVAAPQSQAPGPRAPVSGPRVVFVGTSLTAGLGLAPEESYPALLQRKADSAGYAARMVNAGLSGETSAGALRRIDWLMREPADVVVIETGANDGLRGLNVDSTRANIEAIVARVRAAQPGARILLAQMEAPPNMGDRYTTAFRAMYPAIARERGLTLVPFLLERVAGVVELNQGDGIHPNEEGEKIVAENVWRVLEPALRESRKP